MDATESKTYDECYDLYRALCERVHVESKSWKNGAEIELWDLWDDAFTQLYTKLLDYQRGLEDEEEARERD